MMYSEIENGNPNDGGGAPQPAPKQYGGGYDYQYYPPHPPRKNRSSRPKIAGSMLIVAGVLGVIMASLMIAGGAYIGGGGTFDIGGGTIDITGIVEAADGTPIENVTLTITDTHITVSTGVDGSYQMLGVPGGEQVLTVEKDGYNTLVHYIYVVGHGDAEFFGNQMVITDDTEMNFSLTVGNDTFTYGDEGDTFGMEGLGPLLVAMGAIFMVFSIIEIIGGVYASRVQKYPVALIGAIFGIFAVGFGIGIILAIIALIMLIMSSDEFNGNGKQPE